MEFKEVGELPINPRIIAQMAKATVRSLIDAAVELLTNSDDSYRRLEAKGLQISGKIELFVSREKGGICKSFWVKDCAEGMSREELKKAIEFGGVTSGFEKGQTVRGLFGRGLKEAIISLGEGEICSIKDNTLNIARVWWDKDKSKPFYGLMDEIKNPIGELLQKIRIEQGNGTLVKIDVKNEKIKVPELKNLKYQLSNHFALREMNSSDQRTILLTFEDIKKNIETSNIKLLFEHPGGELVYDHEIKLPGYGDSLRIRLFKSSSQLDSPYLNPFAKSGLLIKTEAAILDNTLFKYETEPAACYFWGEVYCEGMAERIRKGETGIIDPNRGGIEWRHEYCQCIQMTVEKILEPFIQEKRKELEKPEEKKEISEPTKKMLRKLCDLLNGLAKKEFEEWETPAEPTGKIERLTILPRYANIEIDTPRPLSVYAPLGLVKTAGNKVIAASNNYNIQLLSLQVTLNKHPKHLDLCYGVLKVVGRVMNEEADIYCKLGEQKDKARVKVAKPGKKPIGGPTGRKGGFISNIVPDETSNPIQRVFYDKDIGEIRIYVKFPGVARYIGSGLKGAETDQGKVILAELVGEAFCKALATKMLDEGKRPKIPGAEIESFSNIVNEMQKKHLDRIHAYIAG